MLKFVYTIFIGILIVAFVGLGVDAFYQSPTRPDYPEKQRMLEPTAKPTEKEQATTDAEWAAYQIQSDTYEKLLQTYNRNVSIIALFLAVIVLTVSVMYSEKLPIISDGLILGGVLTLAYSLIRGFNADSQMFRFIMVSVGLGITLALGYARFIKPAKKNPS